MRLSLLLIPLLLLSCATAKPSLPPAAMERYEYENAVELLARGKTQDAIDTLSLLAESASNPEVAELASLRLGEALFSDGRHAEAAEVFRQFVDQFGSSPNVPQALYMTARTHLERLPSDFFLLPQPAEREQADLRSAKSLLQRLIVNHPQSHAAAKGRVLFTQTVHKSCQHELYVASFYESREQPKAVVLRLEALLAEEERLRSQGLLPESYQLCGQGREALKLLQDAYRALNKPEQVERVQALMDANKK